MNDEELAEAYRQAAEHAATTAKLWSMASYEANDHLNQHPGE